MDTTAKRTVHIQPFGQIEPEVIEAAAQAIRSLFQFEVKLLPKKDNPLYALSADREQYSAPSILRVLAKTRIDKRNKILGIVDKDLYVRGRNYVFGQAQVKGRSALISTHRLYNKDKELYYGRIAKEVVHELGHTIGLDHCPDIKCVMHFSYNVKDTDTKHNNICGKHIYPKE